MYINTLPLHSSLKEEQSITEWLQDIQKDRYPPVSINTLHYRKFREWTGVSGDLFDSLLVFENYPVSEIIGKKEWSLRVENLQTQEQNNYPLTIIIGSSEKINIKFSYNTEILKQEYVNEIRDHFENILTANDNKRS